MWTIEYFDELDHPESKAPLWVHLRTYTSVENALAAADDELPTIKGAAGYRILNRVTGYIAAVSAQPTGAALGKSDAQLDEPPGGG